MPTTENKDDVPDPLANLQKIFGLIVFILQQFFTKVVPILGIGFLVFLFLLYLFFQFFNLV